MGCRIPPEIVFIGLWLISIGRHTVDNGAIVGQRIQTAGTDGRHPVQDLGIDTCGKKTFGQSIERYRKSTGRRTGDAAADINGDHKLNNWGAGYFIQ